MTTPPKTAPDFDDEDEDEPPQVTPEASLAADDPTAVWDADALRAAGLGDIADEQPDARELPPATAAGEKDGPPSIVTPLTEDEDEQDGTVAMDEASVQHVTRRDDGGGWGRTLLLALVLGTAVYFAVRYLR